MKKFLLFLLLFSLNSFGAEPIKVVVLDTGFKTNTKYKIPLCENFHYDATNAQAKASNIPPTDTHGHGTHIVGVINQFAQNLSFTKALPISVNVENVEKIKNINPIGYCFVIVKYYNEKTIDAVKSWARGLKHIQTIPGKLIINLSGGGDAPLKLETNFIKSMLSKNNKIVAAMGNGNNTSSYYPASEYGVTAVGAMEVTPYLREDKNALLINKIFINEKSIFVYKARYSNYGHSKIVWRFGDLYSGGLNDDIVLMRGTSQATAMQTGLELNSVLKTRRNNELSANSREN
jgi:subtilisin family serine protease